MHAGFEIYQFVTIDFSKYEFEASLYVVSFSANRNSSLSCAFLLASKSRLLCQDLITEQQQRLDEFELATRQMSEELDKREIEIKVIFCFFSIFLLLVNFTFPY